MWSTTVQVLSFGVIIYQKLGISEWHFKFFKSFTFIAHALAYLIPPTHKENYYNFSYYRCEHEGQE